MRVALIGSLPPPLGGTAITLQALQRALAERADVELGVVDTSRIRGGGVRALAPAARVVAQLLREVAQADVVSVHVATTAMPSLGFASALLCRVLGKPLILRKFASTDYLRGGSLRAALSTRAIRLAPVFLVETRRLLQLSRDRGHGHTSWFPTHRDRPALPERQRPDRAARFVFIGHVRAYKGIAELLQVATALAGSGVSIDAYGPLMDGFTEADLAAGGVRYGGVLAPEAVMPTMATYDALVLPTKATTEGYPGAIIEAQLAGLPVIASDCGAIAELVDDSCGVLIAPGVPAELEAAIRALHDDPARYQRLCAGAATRARELSTAFWAEAFVAHCQALAPDPPTGGA